MAPPNIASPSPTPTRRRRLEELHSAEEFRDTYFALSVADKTRIRKIASFRCIGTMLEQQDLLNEALVRTLDGTRAWRRGIDIVHHMDQVMRGIVWVERRRWEREHGDVPQRMTRNGEATLGIIEPASGEPTPEQLLCGQRLYQQILGALADDPIAQSIMIGRMRGLTRAEITKELGLTAIKYASTCRTISRRLERFQRLWS